MHKPCKVTVPASLVIATLEAAPLRLKWSINHKSNEDNTRLLNDHEVQGQYMGDMGENVVKYYLGQHIDHPIETNSGLVDVYLGPTTLSVKTTRLGGKYLWSTDQHFGCDAYVLVWMTGNSREWLIAGVTTDQPITWSEKRVFRKECWWRNASDLDPWEPFVVAQGGVLL